MRASERSEFPALATAERSVWERSVYLPLRPHDKPCRDMTRDGYQATADIYIQIDEWLQWRKNYTILITLRGSYILKLTEKLINRIFDNVMSRFQTFALLWMLCAFVSVIPRHLRFKSRRFGTLYRFHLPRQVKDFKLSPCSGCCVL